MRRLSVWIDLIGMGQALAGHGPASGPASGARKRSGRTLQRPRPWWSSRNACEQFSAEMLESGQFPSRARSRAHSGVRRSPLVHWRLLTRLLHSPVVVWSWFCDIKITIPPLTRDHMTRAAPRRRSPRRPSPVRGAVSIDTLCGHTDDRRDRAHRSHLDVACSMQIALCSRNSRNTTQRV